MAITPSPPNDWRSIHEHIEDLEDLQLAEDERAEVSAGRSVVVSLEEVMRRYGLSV